MTQSVYVIDTSPKARNLIFGKPALEQFRLYFLEIVNQNIVDNRDTSLCLIALTSEATLACPLIDKRFPLQDAARKLDYSNEMEQTEITHSSFFDSLKLAQMALNQRVNKETIPEVFVIISSNIQFDMDRLERDCKAVRKNGLHCEFYIAGEARAQSEIYEKIAEFVQNSKVTPVDSEQQLMIQEDMDDELKQVMELSREEYMKQETGYPK